MSAYREMLQDKLQITQLLMKNFLYQVTGFDQSQCKSEQLLIDFQIQKTVMPFKLHLVFMDKLTHADAPVTYDKNYRRLHCPTSEWSKRDLISKG